MAERFSASVAGKHMACHGSANLAAAIPGWTLPPEDRTADNAANRGTAKHEMLEPILRLPTREVQAFARLLDYVGDVRSRRRFNVLVEQEVTATWLKTEPKTTADLVLHVQDEIHVLDSKWGRIPVSAYNNAQLKFYAVCYASLAPKAKGVTVHIMQPMIDNFESTFVTSLELQQFMADAIYAESQIQAGDTTLSPGDHCTFCPANPHSRASLRGTPPCPAMMQIHYPRYTDEDEILAMAREEQP